MFEILEKETYRPRSESRRNFSSRYRQGPFAGSVHNIAHHKDGERIPLTVADKDAEKGTITLVWQEVGTTTYYMGTMCVGGEV